jgi:hypothetical protein
VPPRTIPLLLRTAVSRCMSVGVVVAEGEFFEVDFEE